MWVTKLSLKRIDEATRKRVLETLKFCEIHDRTGVFNYKVRGNFVVIESSSRDQAFRRGHFFHLRFPDVFYNCEKVRNKGGEVG